MAEQPRNFQHLWRSIGSERRRAAATALLARKDQTNQILATNLIATRLKFRPHKAAALPAEKKAGYIAGIDTLDESTAGALIRDYLFGQQRPMLSRFLDLLGIPHKNGEIEEGAEPAKPTADALRNAVSTIRGEFDAEEVGIYLSALLLADPEFWSELKSVDAPASEEAQAS
jgi:hypothetical protein